MLKECESAKAKLQMRVLGGLVYMALSVLVAPHGINNFSF